MACLKAENSYCTGPECEIFDPINPNCKETRCLNFIADDLQNKSTENPDVKE